MNPSLRFGVLRVLRLVSFGLIFSICDASEKIDLARTTPVPASEQIPIADFFRPLVLQQPKLNPMGTHIAAIITAGEDRHQLLVFELKTKKIEVVGGSGDKDVYWVDWLNDHRLLFGLSTGKMYGLGLLAADVGSIDHAYPLLQYYGSRVISVPTKDRLFPLVWNSYDSLETGHDLGVSSVNSGLHGGGLINLYGANADNSQLMDARDNNDRHLAKRYPSPPTSNGMVDDYLADREGNLAFAFIATNGEQTLYRLADGNNWVKCPVDLESVDIVGCGDDPNQLVVIGPRQEGKPRALQLMDAVTGKLGEVLLQDTTYDFHGWLYRSPSNGMLLGAVFERNGPRVVWFDKEYNVLQKILDEYFPGLVVHIIGSDEAQKLFLVATFSDRQPVIYKWVDLDKRTIGLVKGAAPWIDPERMRPVNIINFKTRDGRKLDAYLTLPAGASKKNPPPMVVLPHGGPWVRDTWGFDGEAQFLASRGYAVLQPNYRGSTGNRWMFPVEDSYDFKKMHDDVTDATKAMVASGYVDGGRVAIMGGSFGGYLAVSGVVNEPSLYRCAVTIAGVFDWAQQIKDKKYDRFDSPVYGWMMLKLGDPKLYPEKYDSISPGRHADKIQVPVFVAGGKDDYTVEIEQSKTLISALEKYHVPHETYLVGEEGHGMHHLDHQVELYRRIEAFLAKNLAPKS
jgi:acetyl esterase/lipase